MSETVPTSWAPTVAAIAAALCVGLAGLRLRPRTIRRRSPGTGRPDSRHHVAGPGRLARPSAREPIDLDPIAGRASFRVDRIARGWNRSIEWRRARRRGLDPAAIGAWVDGLATAVRRGATLRQALVEVRPDSERLDSTCRPLRRAIQRGAGVPDACTTWTAGLRDVAERERRQLIATATVIGVAARIGGAVGQPLDRLAASMRASAADDMERAAHAAQARMSARVLTLLPLAVLGLMVVIDPGVRDVLASPAGLVLIVSGLGLNSVGGWWMRRIISGGHR